MTTILTSNIPANNGKPTCFPTSSLNWSQKAQLTAAQFYAGLTGWTFGFGAGLDAGAGIGPKGSSWNFGAGGSASTLIVADGAGNSGFLNSASRSPQLSQPIGVLERCCSPTLGQMLPRTLGLYDYVVPSSPQE